MEEVIYNLVQNPVSGEWGKPVPGHDPPIKVLRSTNFTNEGRLNLTQVVERSIPSKKINEKLLAPGDIIIEKSGGSPNQPVGRVVYFDQAEGRYLFSNFTSSLRPVSTVHPRYLFYQLFAHHKFGTTLAYQNKTTGIINLQLKRYLKEVAIPLPPLETQKKIAAILDKADELIQNDMRILDKYDQLVQSVFLEMFGDPVSNPMGWETFPLGDFGNWKSGGTPSRQNPEYYQGEVPWLTSGELEHLFAYDSVEHITEKAIEESAAKIIEVNSLLLGMYDTAALKSTITKVRCACNQAIAFAMLDETRVNTVFLYHLIQYGKDHFRRMQRGVRQKNMNLSMIKSTKIPTPPVALQNQFTKIVEEILTPIDLTVRSLRESETLFQSLLQRAFEGELV